jgi:hypothetical protein
MSAKTAAVYEGTRHNGALRVRVQVPGESAPLPHPVRHSPTGFECGYGGSGPSDLARCILLDFLGDVPEVERVYQTFKFEVIAELPRNTSWLLNGSYIAEWLKQKGIEVDSDPEERACTCDETSDPGDHEESCPLWREETRAEA